MRKRVAVLISGRGSNMEALLQAAGEPSYPAEIALVLSNRPNAPGLARAAAAGIATACVDHAGYRGDRAGHEAAVDSCLRAHGVVLVCLAGYMRLLTPWLVGAWEQRMLNVHPSLLPAFPGLGHAPARARGGRQAARLHGAPGHG